MNVYGKSHIGNIRQNNEDNFIIEDKVIGSLLNIIGVADGMGGHNGGEMASRECIENFFISVKNNESQNLLDIIKEGIKYANEKILKMSLENTELFEMGTTFTVATFKDNLAYCGHVGDSRIYSYKDSVLKLESVDHTLLNEFKMNGLSLSEMEQYGNVKNVITRAVGINAYISVDTFTFEAPQDTQIVICSDGLTTHVSDDEIKEVLDKDIDIEAKVDMLVDKALDAGGVDNVTIILAII
ncbi:MAG: protein phosphatase 2C domain-containing protein [Lachnospirales bacterium]